MLMKKMIWEMFNNYPNLFVHFYCEDIRAHYIPLFFINQGIPADRYKIILNCDGSGEYTNFYSIKTEEKWNEISKIFSEKFELARQGILKDPWDTEYAKHMFFYANLPNVVIVPQTMEYLQSDIPIINKTIESMNKEVVDPVRDVFKISEEYQQMFFKMTGVDKEYWKKEYFPKKPMMIIGTNSQDYGYYFNSFEEFRIYLVSLMTFYSSDYSVCFKPHPSAKITQEFRDMMNESKIPIIETQVPGEAIMAAFEDVKVGGYFSTIFLSGTPDFVFAKSENDITAFYRPTIKTLNCKYISTARDLRDRFGDEFVDGKDDKEETSSSIPENTNSNNAESSNEGNDGSSESEGGGANQSSDPQSTTKVAVAAVVPIVILGAVCIFLVVLLIRNKAKAGGNDEEP